MPYGWIPFFTQGATEREKIEDYEYELDENRRL